MLIGWVSLMKLWVKITCCVCGILRKTSLIPLQTRMKKKKPKAAKKPQQPGPKPDLLKIEGDWRDAVKKSLEKKKPADGWPK